MFVEQRSWMERWRGSQQNQYVLFQFTFRYDKNAYVDLMLVYNNQPSPSTIRRYYLGRRDWEIHARRNEILCSLIGILPALWNFI